MVVGESARVKERQTRRRRRPRLLLLLLLCGEARDGSIATTTKTFPRSRSTFAPLEKARRSNWVTDRPTLVLPPPPAILPYHERRPFFLAPILPLPRLNFRLVSTSPRLVRISERAHTPLFSHFFLSFRSRAHEGEEEIVKREIRSLPLHVSSRRRQLTHDNLLHFHSSAESLNFVINGRRKVGWYTTKRSEGFSLVYRSIDTDYCIDRALRLTDRAPRQLVPV